LTETS